MKKTALGCFAALAFLVFSYAGWVSYPPSRHAAEARELHQRLQTQFEQSQRWARDPQKNAYLDPQFLPYWGRKDLEHRPGSEPERIVNALTEWSDLAQKKPAGIEKNPSDPKLQAAIQEFQPLLAGWTEATHKPAFVAPESSPPHFETVVPNYLALRNLAQAASAYSHWLITQGRGDEALQHQLVTLRMSRKLAGEPAGLLSTMIAIACGDVARLTIQKILVQPNCTLSPQLLKELLSTLEQTQLPAERISQSFETEYYVFHNSFLDPKSQSSQMLNQLYGPWQRFLPGVQQRESRMATNDYMDLLESFRNDSPQGFQQKVQSMNEGGPLGNWWTGRHSLVSTLLIPNLVQSQNHLSLARRRQSFLHLQASLQSYRRQHGSWPQSLEQLKVSGYPPLEGLEWNEVEWNQGVLQHRLPAPEAGQLQSSALTPDWDWLHLPEWRVELTGHPVSAWEVS